MTEQLTVPAPLQTCIRKTPECSNTVRPGRFSVAPSTQMLQQRVSYAPIVGLHIYPNPHFIYHPTINCYIASNTAIADK